MFQECIHAKRETIAKILQKNNNATSNAILFLQHALHLVSEGLMLPPGEAFRSSFSTSDGTVSEFSLAVWQSVLYTTALFPTQLEP